VPLANRPRPEGRLLAALAWDGNRLWAVGDSGLVAWSRDDSLWTRLATPGPAALHCVAVSGGGRVICAGDSGRVLLLEPDRARPLRLGDGRAVQAIGFVGETGLLAGDEGLLARSRDGGRSWELLDAPLPMRFRCLRLETGRWWLAGAGGLLLHSEDEGASWSRWREPRRRAIVALAAGDGPGRILALTIDGRLAFADGAGIWEEAGRLPAGEGFSLEAWPADAPEGWLAGGARGELLWLPRSGDPQTIPIPGDRWSTLPALLARPDRLVLAGNWGLLAVLDPLRDDAPLRLEHDLFGTREAPGAAAEDRMEPEAAVAELPPDSLPALDEGRWLLNLLETDPRLSTPPTRLRQLLSSYNQARPTGIHGTVVLGVDIGSGGAVEDMIVLDEWPTGLGFGRWALDVAAQFSYTPGFAEGRMVPSRTIQRLFFEGDQRQGSSWLAGEGGLPGMMDSLLAVGHKPQSGLEPKRLVRELGFPQAARRFFWEGRVTAEFRLDASGAVHDPVVLWESVEGYGFGEHALGVLPELRLAWPEELSADPNRMLRVIQRLNFDRKRYKRAQRAEREGFRFVETLLATVEPDSAEYAPGAGQLVWLAAQFFGEERVRAWPPLEAQVELGGDGRVHDCRLLPLEAADAADPPDLDALRSLALYFTWGRFRADTEADRRTVTARIDFSAARGGLDAAPPSLRPLFEDVSY
jgi:photosystem II stability/assembly factor-like uncharacterized protein